MPCRFWPTALEANLRNSTTMLIARLDPVARNLLIGHPHPAAADAEYEKVIAVEASESEMAHDEIAVSLRPKGLSRA